MKRKTDRAKSQALKDMKSQGDLYLNDFDELIRTDSYSNPGFKRGSFRKALYVLLLAVAFTSTSCESRSGTNKGDSYYVELTLKQYPDWDIAKAEDYLFMSDSMFLSKYYGPLNEEMAVYDIYTEKDAYFVNNTYLPDFYWVVTESGYAFKLAKYEFSEWLNSTIIPENILQFEVISSQKNM